MIKYFSPVFPVFATHKLSYAIVAGSVLLSVLLPVVWLYRRLHSKRHSLHQARLVRFQIFFALLAALVFGTLLLLLNNVFASGH